MVSTAYQKKKAYAMLAAGERPVDIQKRVAISAGALYTRRSREKKRAQIGNPPVRPPGRRAKLDQTMKDQIIKWATEERRSAAALVALVAANFSVAVSETTVRAVLNARKVRLWWHSSPSAKV